MKIEIKPNDQSYIGNKIVSKNWTKGTYFGIKYVGSSIIIGDQYCEDGIIYQGQEHTITAYNWELYEEPEEKQQHSFKITCADDGIWHSKCELCDEMVGWNKGKWNSYKCNKYNKPEEKCEHEWTDCEIGRIKECKKCGLNEYKFEEPQGHHCTGKCTKLGIEYRDEWEKYTKEGVASGRLMEVKEKECEHDFVMGINICRKCEFKKDPFWLKVGDVIKLIEGGVPFKVENIDFKNKIIFILMMGTCKNLKIQYKFDQLNKNKYKKIKLVSPAIIKSDKNQFITSTLFSEKSQISKCKEVYSSEIFRKEIADIIWPAKDQFGKEIWYEVEE